MVKKKTKKKVKIESPSLLYQEYDWYENLFPIALQKSSDGFFLPGLTFYMIGVSKNINLLQLREAHFVTKVRIDKFYDMFLRISEGAIALLLNKGLGRAGRPFNIENVSDLEKNMLTGFNEYVSRIIVPFLEPPPVVNFVRTNFDMTHITFLVKDEEEGTFGRFIVSVPDGRMSPEKIESLGDKFEFTEFYGCHTDAKLVLGKTRFSVDELKSLEEGDLVILEDSDIRNLTLYIQDEVKTVHIEPNMDIELPFDNDNGGETMTEKAVPKNLWDTIEVDMYAELDPVKISLGNLKKIELGQVVDVAALYDNQITLRVENKVIGHGELVIVNDRYGVKIADILQKSASMSGEALGDFGEGAGLNLLDQSEQPQPAGAQPQAEAQPVPQQATAPAQQSAEEGGEEEFDYSDFELDDSDI